MALKEKIKENLRKAMTEKETLKVSVLRMLLAAVQNKEKEKRAKLAKEEKDTSKLEALSELSDEEILEVISSEIKKRKDSIEQYQKGNRTDLAEQEKKERDILMEYLPEQMPEDEIRKLIKEKIKELAIGGPQETGKLMAVIMPQLKGKADGNLVNKIVQEELKK